MLLELRERKRLEDEAKEIAENPNSFQNLGISEEVINATEINDLVELLKIKNSFRTKFQNLMTNVLKIALGKEEEKIACIITAYYEISL
jgi:predicted outer membrane protein